METPKNMAGKKILIITAGFYPQNNPRSFRATELAKEFSRQGHEVVVYVPKNDFNYSNFEKEFRIEINDLGKLRLKSFVVKGNKAIKLTKRAINRFLQLLIEYPNIELMPKVRKALKQKNGFDLLISIAVPHPVHWGVAWARSRKNPIAKVWVADCGDPYMGDRLDSFKKLFYFKYLEKWFCDKADFITVPNSDHIDYYYHEFKPKIRIIPQGFKFEDSNIYKGEVKNAVPTFAFAGRFLPKLRDPGPFLDHLVTLDTEFRFAVYTPNIEFLTPYKKRLGNKLVIKGFVPREELLYELSQMDFLLHI